MLRNVYIVNDLPLFVLALDSNKNSLFEKKISSLLLNTDKSRIRYKVVKFVDVQEWIRFFRLNNYGKILVIGSLPKLIIKMAYMAEIDKPIFLSVKRIRDDSGKNIGYFVLGSKKEFVNKIKLAKNVKPQTLNIFEDIIFTGGTINYLLEEIKKADREIKKLLVYCLIASREAIDNINKNAKKVKIKVAIRSKFLISGIPIEEFVVFFISDLVFGEVNGVKYIEKEEWMERCFGKYFIDLRAILEAQKLDYMRGK